MISAALEAPRARTVPEILAGLWPGLEAKMAERIEQAELAADPVSLRDHLHQVDPGKHLGWWHVGAMIEACQAVLDGEMQNLLICAPPRTYKSRITVQGVSSCRLRNEPRSKVMIACAASDLVLYHSRHARAMALAAGVAIKPDSRAVNLWETAQHGTYSAITVRGARLGFGWDWGIVDDPFSSLAEAQSRLVQRRTWEWWRDDFQTRKQDRPEGGPPGQIMQHQRLSRGDTAHKLLAWLEETGAEPWHALILSGYAEAKPYALPSCVTRLADPRKPGEPLCDDPGTMAPIADRRENNPRLHLTVDQQDPPDDKGGRVFPWLPILGTSRPDLADPVAAIEAMAAAGEIAAPRRWLRGHDYAAGGADAVASAGLCLLAPGQGIEAIYFDPTREYPPAAGVEGVGLANARRYAVGRPDGAGSTGPAPPTPGPYFIEQAIPREVGVGGTFTARMQRLLEGFRVHLMPVSKGKLALAQPLAAACTPSCRLCARVVVDAAEREAMGPGSACECDEPDVKPGRVAILAGPMAAELQEELHGFDGSEGGVDDLVDSAAAAWNAGAIQKPDSIYPGGLVFRDGRLISGGE